MYNSTLYEHQTGKANIWVMMVKFFRELTPYGTPAFQNPSQACYEHRQSVSLYLDDRIVPP